MTRKQLNSETCECRLCETEPLDHEALILHLTEAHALTKERRATLSCRLHASRDHPEYSENTFGWYEGEQLVYLSVLARERAADDPM